MTQTISPFLDNDSWVFNDPSTGLENELLVSGADNFCDMICAKYHIIPERGFTAKFSDKNDLKHHYKFYLIGTYENTESGNLYRCDDDTIWLCENLLKYFDVPPRTIYVHVVEADLLERAKAFVNSRGLKLVYCDNYDLIDPFVVANHLDGLEEFASNSSNIDWINYHLIKI